MICSSRFSEKRPRHRGRFFLVRVALCGCATFIPQTAELRDRWPADLPLQTEHHRRSVLPADRIPVRARRARDALAHRRRPGHAPTISSPQVYIPARKGTRRRSRCSRRRAATAWCRTRSSRSSRTCCAKSRRAIPVVVLQNYGTWPILKLWHYAVVVGYNSHSGNLVFPLRREPSDLREPIGDLRIHRGRTAAAGRWSRCRPAASPSTADRARYFDAIVARRARGPAARRPRSRTEAFLERWPDDLGASDRARERALRAGRSRARRGRAAPRARAAIPIRVVALNNLAHDAFGGGPQRRSARADRPRAGADGPHACEAASAETRALILKRLQQTDHEDHRCKIPAFTTLACLRTRSTAQGQRRRFRLARRPTSRACGRCAARRTNTIARSGGRWPSSAGSASRCPKRYGGMGLGLTETAIVAEGLARALAPEPLYRVRRARRRRARGVRQRSAQARAPAAHRQRRAYLPALAWQESAGHARRRRTSRRARRRSKAAFA